MNDTTYYAENTFITSDSIYFKEINTLEKNVLPMSKVHFIRTPQKGQGAVDGFFVTTLVMGLILAQWDLLLPNEIDFGGRLIDEEVIKVKIPYIAAPIIGATFGAFFGMQLKSAYTYVINPKPVQQDTTQKSPSR